MPDFVRAATLSDLAEGALLGVKVGETAVCLARVDGEVYAFRDNCSHRDFPLSDGELDAEECLVTCDWHGATFDIRTGAARSLPATRPITVYEVKVEGDDILVQVGE